MCIVNAHKEGKGYKAISKQFQVPVATIQSIIRKYKEFHTVRNVGGRGRNPKVSPRLARQVWREANNNPRITIKGLLNNLGESGTKISRQTLQRTLHKIVWHLQERTWTKLQAFGHRFCGQMRRKWSFSSTGMLLSSGGRKGKHTTLRTWSQPSSMEVGASCCGNVSQPVGPGISSKWMAS